MKKTSSKILSLFLCLTLVCTMFVGLGTVETFAEGAKLVKSDERLDVKTANITSWGYNYNRYYPKVDNVANYSILAKCTSSTGAAECPTIENKDGKTAVKFGQLYTGVNYISIYVAAANVSDTLTSGIYEVTGYIFVDHTPNSSGWRVGLDTSNGYDSMFADEYKQLTPNKWYTMKIKVDLDNDKSSICFENTEDAKNVIEKEYSFTRDLTVIKPYVVIPQGNYMWLGDLNCTYYDTSVGTKAAITSVGTTPSETLNFTLDKAIIGLEADDISVIGSGDPIQATALTDNGGGSYTATLAEALAATTDYTLVIDGACYDGYLEVSGTDYVDVADISHDFKTAGADPQEYVDSLAASFNWSNVTTEYAANNVTAAITLPTSYESAAVSWTSNPDVIDEEGKLIIPPSGEMTATLQPTLTYQGKTATPASINITLVKPLIYDGTKKFSFINPDVTRYDNATNKATAYDQGVWLIAQGKVEDAGSTWNSYFQIDFTGYEEILEDPTTKLTFSAHMGGYQGTMRYGYGAAFYVVNDSSDAYADDKGITGTKAQALGLHTVTAEQLVAEKEDTTGLYNDVYTQAITPEGKQAILNALKSGTDNSIVTFTVKSAGGESWINTSKDTTFIQIDYASEKVDNQTYLDNVANSLTWDKLSGEEQTAVTENLKMTSKFMGADVVWTSTNTAALGTDGTIHPLRNDAQTTNLSAVLSYKTATPKEVDLGTVTVAKEKMKSIKIDATATEQVGGKEPEKNYTYNDQWNAFYLSARAMNSQDGDRGDSMAFMKFDLSAYLDDIKLAKNISLNIGNRIATRMGTTGVITLLNDSSDDWDKDITYNIALSKGMQTDPGLYTAENVNFEPDMITVADDAFTSAVKTAIAQDNAEGIITFRLYAMDSEQCNLQIGPDEKTSTPAPYIEIQYYESDVAGAETPEITWDAISDQDMDNVVADLTLPATWYGETVTWQSANSAIDAATGAVTIGAEAKGKLTATIGSATKEFDVTVPASNVAVRSARMYENAEETRINYTNGYIYANEAVASCSVLIATYSADGELISITQKAMPLAEGRNHVYSELHYGNAANTATKIIVVENMTNLKPLAVAK